jgi:hypothetical protein
MNIIGAINSRRMGWARRVTSMGEMRSAHSILINLKARDHSGDPHVDGRILLNLKKIVC